MQDYVVQGWFTAQSDKDDRQTSLNEVVLFGHSLVVLYALGAMLAGRRTRMNTAIVVSGIARRPTNAQSGNSFARRGSASRGDIMAEGRGFLAREGRALTLSDYRVASRPGAHAEVMMLNVSGPPVETPDQGGGGVNPQDAIERCLWQCHYSMVHNTSVAIAFGNAYTPGLQDDVLARIQDEVMSIRGGDLLPDYARFFSAVADSVADALLDLARDRAEFLADRDMLDSRQPWLTLDSCAVRAPCEDFCQNAWQQGWLSNTGTGSSLFGRLNSTETEERCLNNLLRLLADFEVHPRHILTELELGALRGQAGNRWPSRFDFEEDRYQRLRLTKSDFTDLSELIDKTDLAQKSVVELLTTVSRLDVRHLAKKLKQNVLPLARSEKGRVWRARSNRHGTLYLIGTMHSTKIHQLEPESADAMIRLLEGTPFTHVFEEVTANLSSKIRFPPSNSMGLHEHLALTRQVEGQTSGKMDRNAKRAKARLANMSREINWLNLGMDDPVAAIALNLHKGGSKNITYGGLETENTRAVVKIATRHQRANAQYDDRFDLAHLGEIERAIMGGDEQAFWRILIDEYLGRGIDVQSSDARNLKWIRHIDSYSRNDTVLWVVGAGHIPGLLFRLLERNFTLEPIS
ncbi:hypothetical protein KYC5002_27140 [Archangium violaceum]|uniref:hypothetical protein n=1 Tax=Archangium violaceum TaxID=83451 RepID=UPI002B2970D8|nr:hypothetical protein KYC5002_27140 [Archangium gephyra]